jgi:hypothetical protein
MEEALRSDLVIFQSHQAFRAGYPLSAVPDQPPPHRHWIAQMTVTTGSIKLGPPPPSTFVRVLRLLEWASFKVLRAPIGALTRTYVFDLRRIDRFHTWRPPSPAR